MISLEQRNNTSRLDRSSDGKLTCPSMVIRFKEAASLKEYSNLTLESTQWM